MMPLPTGPQLGAAVLLLFVPLTSLRAQDPPKKQPIRLDDHLGTPAWLTVSGQHRTRFESLNNQFRANPALRNTEDQLANRSLLRVDYRRERWGATLEGIDGRMFGTHADSFADTTTVNTLDLLQAYVSWQPAEGHTLAAGRWTMDLGSRRLVARNEYRNTINSFVGLRWDYVGEDGYEAGAFWSMPTIRRPSDRRPTGRMDLVDNEHDWDTQSSDTQFFGVHAQKRIDAGSTGQVYLLGFDDTRGTADEQIWTLGFRYYRPAKPGKLFGEVEAAYQFGESGPDDIDAHFVHGSIGYTCDCPMEPGVRLAIDLATGDDGDSDEGRFNTLFGARRFEYGPTGIWGAIGRRNLISPEVRFSLRPTPTTWVLLAVRDIRLESSSDAWVEAGDNTGEGKHVGTQTECRLRWEPCRDNLRFETGGAYLAGGNYRETSTTGRSSDARYFFFETILTF